MVINISVQYNGWPLLDIIMLTQGYYYHHRGTRLKFKCHVGALSLQPMKQDIITTMFDAVLL